MYNIYCRTILNIYCTEQEYIAEYIFRMTACTSSHYILCNIVQYIYNIIYIILCTYRTSCYIYIMLYIYIIIYYLQNSSSVRVSHPERFKRRSFLGPQRSLPTPANKCVTKGPRNRGELRGLNDIFVVWRR